MADERSLMCVLAHPDDESLGTGGTLAKYAAMGVATHLVTATRGERGWARMDLPSPGMRSVGQIREAELRAAAQVLGLRGVAFLDYVDGELDQAEPPDVIGKLVDHLRRVRPQVVITFGPDGSTGHPDHIAISQFTTAAVLCAADPRYGDAEARAPHRVTKLYYYVAPHEHIAAYEAAFGGGALCIDGVARQMTGWPDWSITTRIDCTDYWRVVCRAIACHRSQLPTGHVLEQLPEAQHRMLWGIQEYYRVFSLLNGGRAVEDDLFAGID